MLTEALSFPYQLRFPSLLSPPVANGPLARRTGLAAQPAAPASTYGWDTVFAIRATDVNKQLAKPGVCPPQFAQNKDGIGLSGNFAAWQICLGGGGTNLHMAIPISVGALVYQGQTAVLDGAVATVEIKLNYLPAPPATGTTRKLQKLIVATVPLGQSDVVVSVLNMTLPSSAGNMVKYLAMGALTDWFNAHLAEFAYIFNLVDLNAVIDKDAYQWLSPTSVGYAYVDAATLDDSVFGSLCMVQGRSDDNLVPQISQVAVPAACRAGFTIAPSAFLQNMVGPALALAFPGSKASDFGLAADRESLVNLQEVNTKTVTNGGITYQPVVQTLNLAVNGSELVLTTLTRTQISPGIVLYVQNTAYLGIVLNVFTGSPKLKWTQTRAPVNEHWTDVAIGIKIIEAVLAVIAIVIIAILGVLTDGAAFIVAAIIVGIVMGLAAATPELIAAVIGGDLSDKVPSIDALALNATSTVRWPGAGVFKPQFAGLNGAFQLGGDPCFA